MLLRLMSVALFIDKHTVLTKCRYRPYIP